MCGWEWDDTLPYGDLARGARDMPEGDGCPHDEQPRPRDDAIAHRGADGQRDVLPTARVAGRGGA